MREYPLSRQLFALSHVWQSPAGEDYVIAAKGAPEAIADLCHLGAAEMRAIELQVGALAEDGLRVLGVARAAFRRGELPEEQHEFGVQVPGTRGAGRSRAADRPCRDQGVPHGGHPGGDDHGGLSGDGPEHRASDRPRAGRQGRHRARAGRPRRCRPAGAHPRGKHLRARRAGAEAAAGRSPEGERRDRGHDGRRGQRRAGPQVGPHRHRDGRPRDRRGAGVGGAGAPGRRFLLDRRRDQARAPHLRQHQEGRSPTSSRSMCRSSGCRCFRCCSSGRSSCFPSISSSSS